MPTIEKHSRYYVDIEIGDGDASLWQFEPINESASTKFSLFNFPSFFSDKLANLIDID